jgi:hypothetical protein
MDSLQLFGPLKLTSSSLVLYTLRFSEWLPIHHKEFNSNFDIELYIIVYENKRECL